MDGYYALDFNGDSIGLLFALTAHRKFVTEYRDNPELVDEKGNTTEVGIAYLIYSGYTNNCIAEGLRPPYKYSFRDFLTWTEELFFDPSRSHVITEISEAYKNSRTINRDREKPEPMVEETEKNEQA